MAYTPEAWRFGGATHVIDGQVSYSGRVLFYGHVHSRDSTTYLGLTAYAGGGQANGTALGPFFSTVDTVATTADSVKLPSTQSVAGAIHVVHNAGANSMNVFPNTGHAIDALGANNAYAHAAGKTVIYISTSSTAWQTMPCF